MEQFLRRRCLSLFTDWALAFHSRNWIWRGAASKDDRFLGLSLAGANMPLCRNVSPKRLPNPSILCKAVCQYVANRCLRAQRSDSLLFVHAYAHVYVCERPPFSLSLSLPPTLSISLCATSPHVWTCHGSVCRFAVFQCQVRLGRSLVRCHRRHLLYPCM